MKLKFLLLLISICTFINSDAQTCSIKISDRVEFFKKNYKQEMNYFLSLEFEINGAKINTTDTNSIDITIHQIGFDTVNYSYQNRKGLKIEETFICKFREGEMYTISPCTCCGIFLMIPSKNAKRGFVKFNNKSSKEYIAMTSEIDYDSIPKASTTNYIFSSISMNCGFRPNRVFIANYNYLDKKYDYENWSTKSSEVRKKLVTEQEKHIVYAFNYLFLHEEKLIVTISETGNEFDLVMSE